MLSCSVLSDSLRPHGQYPARLLCPWDFPGKNTGVGSDFLLQGIFLTQGSNPGLCRQVLYCLATREALGKISALKKRSERLHASLSLCLYHVKIVHSRNMLDNAKSDSNDN